MTRGARVGVFASLVLGAVVVYAWRIEPFRLGVTRIDLPPDLNAALAGQRIALISDLHIRKNWPKTKLLLDTLQRLDPDYLLIAGDMVWYEADAGPAMEVAKQFHARKGVYAVLGDADYMGRVRNCIYCHVPGSRELRHDLPVRFLRNEAVTIADDKVTLVGLDGEDSHGWDETCRRSITPERPSIVMVHYPQTLPFASAFHPSLILAGDTHGGQIIAPYWVYPLITQAPVKKYRYGWFYEGRTPMFVTRGVGESHIPARLARPPEVVLMEGRS